MYKLLTSSKDSNDLCIGFHRHRGIRQREKTNNKNIEGKYHVRSMLKGVFVFAQCQETAIYGLG